ncbi:hypothetical protein P6144_04185 [Sphingomonas sp. HITSZ_GF]|uniref:hypothetical protein n=1 Tax=Sphingomonas sp. HITSZ_GF TaxID=3037247 RepID=UPI00240DD75E|nr:hypothetical protein [Sphingomonas sp. HITSZ_GF]MDG2532834.1 hypothetical protein [Sphingomonas sp. HITSZ_GF]
MRSIARPTQLAPALLLAATACFAGAPDKAVANGSEGGTEPAAQSMTITGMVLAPAGAPLEDAKVIACSSPYQACKTKIEAPLRHVGGPSWAFELKLPNKGPWQIVAWKDADGNDDASAGDYLGVARDGGEIEAPANAVRISVKKVEGDQSAASASNGDVPALAGTWSQSSTSKELVLASKIKLQPSMATGYGTNLGGTFGPGSATNTTIVTESTPVSVQRQMSLAIQRDGSFLWKISKQHTEGKCTKAVTQEKRGQVLTSGGKMTFAIKSGREGWSSCGKTGAGAISARSETYSYSLSGGALRLSGPGGVNWTFRRG